MVKQLFPWRLLFSLSHHEFLRQRMCSFYCAVTHIATKISGTPFKDRYFSLDGCSLRMNFDLFGIKKHIFLAMLCFYLSNLSYAFPFKLTSYLLLSNIDLTFCWKPEVYIITPPILGCSEVVKPVFYILKSWTQTSLLNLNLMLTYISLHLNQQHWFQTCHHAKNWASPLLHSALLTLKSSVLSCSLPAGNAELASPTFFFSVMSLVVGRTLQISWPRFI